MIKKLSIFSSDFIGVYIKAYGNTALIPRNLDEESENIIRDILGVKTFRVMINNFSLIGTMVAFNSNGIVVSGLSSPDDFSDTNIDGRNILFLKDRLNAVGNNIITNDRAAVIHPSFTESSEKAISDTLGVEVARSAIAGVKTVGSVAVLNDNGMLVSPESGDEEIKKLSDLFGIRVNTGTANYGSYYLGASIITNSKGILVGNATTSIELGRIDDTLS